MAKISLSIEDTEDGGAIVKIVGDDLASVETLATNTLAQNCAISLSLWTKENFPNTVEAKELCRGCGTTDM